MQGDKIWVYPPEKKENGYPKLLQEEFPGIPYPLDAAVECHHGECPSEGVLFFQGVSKNVDGILVPMLMVGASLLVLYGRKWESLLQARGHVEQGAEVILMKVTWLTFLLYSS